MKKLLGKILGAPNAVLRGIAEHAIVGRLSDAAAGQYGPGVASVLAALKGKKLIIGTLLGALAFLAAGLGFDGAAFWLAWIGGPLAAVGLVDKAVHEPGRPDFLADSALYRLLADNAGSIASGLLAAFAYVTSADCVPRTLSGWTVTCTTQGHVLLGVSLLLVYLGILDQGFLTKTPGAVRTASTGGGQRG